MMTTVRQRTEVGLATDGFIEDDELLGYLNASITEVRAIIISKFSGQYFRYLTTITSQAGVDTYPLPPDYWKTLKVRYNLGGNNQWLPMLPYEEQQEDMFNSGIAPAMAGTLAYRYRVQNNSIKFIPGPPSAGSVVAQVWYAPRTPKLVLGVQASVLVPSATAGMGIQYTAVYSGAGGNSLTVTQQAGATTAASMSGNDLTVTLGAGATNQDVVMAVLANIQASAVLRAEAVANPLDLAAETLVLSVVTPAPFVGGAGATGLTDWDGFNGWDELAVLDTCIKVAQKDQSDASGFASLKAAMIQRMNEEAENREQGQVHTGIDTYGVDQTPFGLGYGPYL
jgi:hypothetical protein